MIAIRTAILILNPSPLVPPQSRRQYKTKISKLGNDTLKVIQERQFTGKELWIEFISFFRPHSIKVWDPHLLIKWTTLLRRNGIHVEHDLDTHGTQKLIDLLFSDSFIGTDMTVTKSPLTILNLMPENTDEISLLTGENSAIRHPSPIVQKNDFIHPDYVHQISRPPDFPLPVENTPATHHTTPKHQPSRQPTDPDGDPSDDDDNTSDKEDRKPERHGQGLRDDPPPHIFHHTDSSGSQEQKVLGISGLMKAYYGKPTFAGIWEEDI